MIGIAWRVLPEWSDDLECPSQGHARSNIRVRVKVSQSQMSTIYNIRTRVGSGLHREYGRRVSDDLEGKHQGHPWSNVKVILGQT